MVRTIVGPYLEHLADISIIPLLLLERILACTSMLRRISDNFDRVSRKAETGHMRKTWMEKLR